ncbi:hypothetical protein TNCV_2921511 [Trichonephila clavipes]|nr:hypothetical protein TNCV_2921511 [Trichonephila clavipes]
MDDILDEYDSVRRNKRPNSRGNQEKKKMNFDYVDDEEDETKFNERPENSGSCGNMNALTSVNLFSAMSVVPEII